MDSGQRSVLYLHMNMKLIQMSENQEMTLQSFKNGTDKNYSKERVVYHERLNEKSVNATNT
jgi:hypothetical protein